MKRRILLCAGVALCAGMIQGADPTADGFENPPKEVRPCAWWIWFENAVEKPELLRELAVLDDAGFGGVNVEMNGARDWWNGYGPEVKTWLSPEWLECMRAVTDEAARSGMTVDTLANTGWSLGGGEQVLPKQDCNSKLSLVEIPLKGGSHFEMKLDEIRRKTPRGKPNDRIVFLRILPASPEKFTAGKDLLDTVQNETLTLDVPKGDWVLYAGVQVKPWASLHAGCGEHGWTVDPYNPEAVRRYLDVITPKYAPAFGGSLGKAFRAFELESVEFQGANWTENMEAEFLKRRGYSLTPYLPFVCAQNFKKEKIPPAFLKKNEFGEAVRRARYDYHKTLTELMYEAYYGEFHKWCGEQGVLSRIQVSGAPFTYDRLKAATFTDLPEPELWLYRSEVVPGRPYQIGNESAKLASSGAHIAGKKRISCETFTCTDGVYQIAPWYIKQGNDLNSIAGVNSSIVHTFPYHHPGTPYPAGFWYGDWSEDNPWWPYVKYWTAYNGRISWLMQQGVHQAQVLILNSREEVLWEAPQDDWSSPDYLHGLWRAIAAQGCGSDFINEELLQQAHFQNGRIVCQKAAWDILLIPSRTTLEVKTAERIARLAEAGAKIRFIDTMPEKSPGLKDAEENDAAVKRLCDEALKRATVQKVPASGDDLVGWTGELLTQCKIARPCVIAIAAELLMQSQYRIGNRDFFFFCNVNRDEARTFNVSFLRQGAAVELWDPDTGARWSYPRNADGSIDLRLEPAQSVVLVLSPETTPLSAFKKSWPRDSVQKIETPWEAEMIPGQGAPWNRKFAALKDFSKTEDERLLNFAGTVVYETRFDVADPSAGGLLSLGDVQYTSEVWLNGKHLGVRWWGNHVYEAGDALKAGENVLRVKVATPIWNYVRNQTGKGNAAIDHQVGRAGKKTPGYGGKPIPAGLIGPVELMRVK